MSLLQATVLGVVQGATEFLPVSSKTHLVVVPALLGWRPPGLAFIVLLHLGTLVGLVAYFLGDLWEMARGGAEGRRLLGLLLAASVPAGVLGLAFEHTFEQLLTHPRWVAASLGATVVVLAGAEWAAGTLGGRSRLPRPLRERPALRDAVAMGLAQAAALLPGVSRSGATMSAGLAGGLSRAAAARFSFLMSVLAIAGANALELPKTLQGGVSGAEAAGFLAAAVSGYAVVAWLLRFLRSHSLLPFAGYCLAFAVLGALRLP